MVIDSPFDPITRAAAHQCARSSISPHYFVASVVRVTTKSNCNYLMPIPCQTAYVLPFRDIQIRKNVVTRLEECETRLTEETKERQSGEKEVRAKLEAQSQTLQSYMDNTADVIRKLTEVCWSNNVLLLLFRFHDRKSFKLCYGWFFSS